MLRNNNYDVKVLLKRFHLNGHITGFHPQTQKLEPPYETPSAGQLFEAGEHRHHDIINNNRKIHFSLGETLRHEKSESYCLNPV